LLFAPVKSLHITSLTTRTSTTPTVPESERQTVAVVIVSLRRLLDDFLDKALAHGIPASW
jgi:hypothetical protein